MKRLYLLMLLVSACMSNAAETMKVLKLTIAPENVVGKVAYPAKNGRPDFAKAAKDHWEFNENNRFYKNEIVLWPQSDGSMIFTVILDDLLDMDNGHYRLSPKIQGTEFLNLGSPSFLGKFVLKAENFGEVPPPPAEEKKASAAQKGGKKKS